MIYYNYNNFQYGIILITGTHKIVYFLLNGSIALYVRIPRKSGTLLSLPISHTYVGRQTLPCIFLNQIIKVSFLPKCLPMPLPQR